MTTNKQFHTDSLTILPNEMRDVVESLTAIKQGLPYMEVLEGFKDEDCPLSVMADCAIGLLVLVLRENKSIDPKYGASYLHYNFHLIQRFYVLLRKHGPDNIMEVLNTISVSTTASTAEVSQTCH